MIMKHDCEIKIDDNVEKAAQAFDYDISSGKVNSEIPDFELPKEDFGIGLIVGGSGSGKTTILKKFQKAWLDFPVSWNKEKAIISHFGSYEEGKEKLAAAGLNSIPCWVKPFRCLSNGEQFRANLARSIRDGAIIDEFTSVVDRNVAKSCSVALSKYVKRNNIKGIVLASCHYDIIEWLQPDWIFDVDIGDFISKKGQDQAFKSNYFRVQPKLGHCSASITISTETSIKVHVVG